MSKEAIIAVVEIRQRRASLSALEEQIMEGRVDVECRPDEWDNPLLTGYVFRARSDNEQAAWRADAAE